MTLGEKIKSLRQSESMTQEDLARICYVSRNAVSKWENDNGYPNIDSIRLICKYFKISIDDLLNDENLEKKEVVKIIGESFDTSMMRFKNNQIIFSLITILLYPIFQILFRELVCGIDPSAALDFDFIISPFLMIVESLIMCFLIKSYLLALLSGVIGFVLTSIIVFILPINGIDFFVSLIYFLVLVFFIYTFYSIRYLRFLFVPTFIKKKLSKIIEVKIKISSNKIYNFFVSLLYTTSLIGIIYFFNSIYIQVNSLPEDVVFRVFTGVPILYFMIFFVLIFTLLLITVSIKLKHNEKLVLKFSKDKIFIIIVIFISFLLIAISNFKFRNYNVVDNKLYMATILPYLPRRYDGNYISIFNVIGPFKILPIIIYGSNMWINFYKLVTPNTKITIKQIVWFVIEIICFIITFAFCQFVL